MSFIFYILIIIILLLTAYIIFIQLQLRHINRQLSKRLNENTRQPVTLELMDKELNKLAIQINKCLKTEENLRLKSIREEKQFKELISNISHDLRTPLTAIKGYQQLIERHELTKEQGEKLKIAKKHTEELGALIDSFYDYSCSLLNEIELSFSRLNLTNLITESLAESIIQFEERNLFVCLEETPPIFINADPKIMKRVIKNLIRNCLLHADGNIEVQITDEKDSAIVLFSNPVKNPSAIDASRLFDRFYIPDHARKNSTGLGLAIVKNLTEQMGGNVAATIQDGIFEIRLEFPLIPQNGISL